MDIITDQIFVDKCGDEDHLPDKWKYFRVTSVTGLGNLEGTEEASIQVCRVKWPTLEDIPPINDSPGVTGLAAAWEITHKALRQWGIERERSIFIGIRDREE